MSALSPSLTPRIPLQEALQLGNRGDSLPRKRKLVDEPSNDLGDYITIRDASCSTIRKVRPREVIPRTALSLAHINFKNSSTTPYPILFSAYIWSLEPENKIDNEGSTVLIVQDEEDALAVVEKVSKGVYTLLWLAKWVTLQDLRRRPAKQRRVELQSQEKLSTSTGKWWHRAAVQLSGKQPNNESCSTEYVFAKVPRVQDSIIENADKEQDDVPSPSLQSPENTDLPILDEIGPVDWALKIREHYLEALYASRASLAYFVKGPLSRARIAYHVLNQERNLADLLRASILPVKVRSNAAVIDKKYSKGILDVIYEIPSGVALEESGEIAGLSQDRISKSRRRKKTTPEGLLAGEEEQIIKWWIRREASMSHEGSESTREQRVKRATLEQKFRETQLQIILILEVMALEAQTSPSDQDGALNQEDSQTQPTTSKEKKPSNLNRALDMLVEKLQIWETMNEDTVTMSADSGEKFSENSNSCLRAFCLDIVLPFYISRLPEASKEFCRKFGVVLSPEKKATRTISSSKIKAKARERPKDHANRRPLDRALTGERVLSKRKPTTLMRSATDSLVPLIKEELAEVSLAKIPAARQSLHQSKFYARREVDLTAEVKATEAKLKRKAEVEQQLKGAIFALKKPNARLAVKEFVDASDQRAASQKGRPRKSQNPIRNPFAPGVQVTATPKIRRYKSHIGARNEMGTDPEEAVLDVSPPSSVPVIPSSTRKPVNGGLTIPNEPFVSFTPTKAARSRQPSKVSFFPTQVLSPIVQHEDEPDSEPELPCTRVPSKPYQWLPQVSRSNVIAATPMKGTSMIQNIGTTSEDNPGEVFSTPRRSTPPTSAVNILASSPLNKRQMSKEAAPGPGKDQSNDQNSLYDSLGWNDDFDL